MTNISPTETDKANKEWAKQHLENSYEISFPKCVRDRRHKCHMKDWNSRDCINCHYGETSL